jgi:hypothetical protein
MAIGLEIRFCAQDSSLFDQDKSWFEYYSKMLESADNFMRIFGSF